MNMYSRYELIIIDPLNSYILDVKEKSIVAWCVTKRPDKKFDKLKEMVELANINNK